MGKKYIIELEDKPFHNGNGDFLYRVKGFNSLVFDMTGVGKLTPYTEPDLEQVREEAYDKGFDAGRTLNTGKYEKGLDDAWEAARTLWNTPNRKEIFGHTTFNTVLTTLTAQEAIEKIRQYEQEQQFHVGDEIETQNGFKGFVISADDKYVYFVNENGEGCVETMMAAKTGRHFPEIAEVLRKMREE